MESIEILKSDKNIYKAYVDGELVAIGKTFMETFNEAMEFVEKENNENVAQS